MLTLVPRLFVTRRVPARPPRRRRARSAVVAGLLAVVAVNVALGVAAELYPRVRDPFYGDKLARLRPLPRPVVLMLGTSRTGFAFHGYRVEERVPGVSAFNFGVPASGPVTHLLYFRRLVRDGQTPDLLLLEILPSMFAEVPHGPLESRWLFADRLTHRELDTVIGLGFDPKETNRRWREATLTPWYGLRFQLLGRVAQSWIPWTIRYDWGRTADGRGWSTPPRQDLTAAERAAAAAQARDEYEGVLRHWQPGGPAVEALRTLLTECRENKVPVKLVLMPESAAFRDWYPPAVRDRLTAFLASVRSEFGCELIDARGWLPDDAFTDGHHQLRIGAEAFSDRLAREVIAPWAKDR